MRKACFNIITQIYSKKKMITPLQDRVIVKRNDASTTTESGIIIPDTAKEQPQEGTIFAVGEGKKKEDGTRITPDIKKGDKVLFGKYAGTEIKIDGEDLLIMREDDIVGVIS